MIIVFETAETMLHLLGSGLYINPSLHAFEPPPTLRGAV